MESMRRLNLIKWVLINNYVCIGLGCNACVAKGNVIEDNSIIASYSKVTHELDSENAIYVGNKKVKENIEFTLIEK